jgi:hypothetical protein
MITPEMKYKCHGEFFVEIEEPCVSCRCNGCEACGGNGFIKKKIIIPWTTIRDIYKAMKECE